MDKIDDTVAASIADWDNLKDRLRRALHDEYLEVVGKRWDDSIFGRVLTHAGISDDITVGELQSLMTEIVADRAAEAQDLARLEELGVCTTLRRVLGR
jgi:hypothetical protein